MPDLPRVEPEIQVFEMASMLGPYSSLDDICKQPSELKWTHTRCGAEVPASTPFFTGMTLLEAPREPYLEVRIVARNDYGEMMAAGDGNTAYHLGLRTRDGWFFLAELARTHEPAMASHHEWLVIEAIRLVETRAGEVPLLELRYAKHVSDDDRGVDETIRSVSSEVVICGFSSNGRPRCTLATPIAESNSVTRISSGAVVSSSAWKLELRYGPSGVELTLPAGVTEAGVPASLVGSHALDFDAPAEP